MRAACHPLVPQALDSLLAGMSVRPAPGPVAISGLSDDSRRVQPGDLFMGLRGLRTNRADLHLGEASRRGAKAALLEGQPDPQIYAPGLPICFHPHLGREASAIAARFYGEPSQSLKVLGVTGTNGKSTVTHLIAQAVEVLQGPGAAGVIGSLGYGAVGALQDTGMTTPGPVQVQQQLHALQQAGLRTVAMEVSSHALDQYRVDATHFAVATFTNLTRDHLDYHGDMQRYGAAKARLFALPGVRAVALNAADPFHTALLSHIAKGIPVIAYSLTHEHEHEHSRLCPLRCVLGPTGIQLAGQWEGQDWRLESPLLGRFNAENLLAALANLILLGYPVADAASALSQAAGAPGRMQRIADPTRRRQIVIDYAHTPDALAQILLTLKGLAPTELWCVFGCGGDRDPGKRALMGAVAARHADVVVLTSDNPRSEDPHQIMEAIRAGFDTPLRSVCEVNRALAIRYALEQAPLGAIVLIAGKGHEAYQEQAGERLPFSDAAWATQILAEGAAC